MNSKNVINFSGPDGGARGHNSEDSPKPKKQNFDGRDIPSGPYTLSLSSDFVKQEPKLQNMTSDELAKASSSVKLNTQTARPSKQDKEFTHADFVKELQSKFVSSGRKVSTKAEEKSVLPESKMPSELKDFRKPVWPPVGPNKFEEKSALTEPKIPSELKNFVKPLWPPISTPESKNFVELYQESKNTMVKGRDSMGKNKKDGYGR